MMVRQNKWRAARYGNQAKLVDLYSHKITTVREAVERLVDSIAPAAAELGCESYLNHCVGMAQSQSHALYFGTSGFGYAGILPKRQGNGREMIPGFFRDISEGDTLRGRHWSTAGVLE